jgi:O-antigen/teichoic acid export membrane protein
LIGFGKWIFVSSAVFVFAVNGDRLLLGGFVEPDVLGVYAIAALIIGAIQGALGKLTIAVTLPALSEVARSEPSRLREVYYKLRVPADLLLLLLAGLLFAAGQLVIDVLYDPRYSAAGGMLQVLALSLIAARYDAAHHGYLALGMPRYLAVINVVRFVSLYALVPVLYHLGGTRAAIWGIALHGLMYVPFDYYFSAQLRMNDFRRELMVLAALPVGYLCGVALMGLEHG